MKQTKTSLLFKLRIAKRQIRDLDEYIKLLEREGDYLAEICEERGADLAPEEWHYIRFNKKP